MFIIFLFLIGLQFGASNLLPNMFQADVLEDIELKTGKRKEEIHEALFEQRKQYNSVESVENE